MKFHGITMDGKFVIQKLASLPTWTSADEGRLVYDQTEKKLYVGTDSAWSEAGGGGGYGLPVDTFTDNGILESGKMYFINTSSGRLHGNLESNPKIGDTVTIVDVAGKFNMFSFTVNGNGKNIHIDSSLEIDVKDVVLILVYTGVSWKLDVGGIIGGGGGSFTAEFDSDFTAAAGMLAFVDTRTNIVTVTLPDETQLSTGATVTLYDQYSTFNTNKCIVISPHAEFENGSTSIELTNNGSKVTFIWDGGSGQWKTEQGSGFGLGNINNISGDYDANVGDFLFVDTTTNPINITLPTSGEIGSSAVISIYDQMDYFKTNNVTVTPAYGTVDGGSTYVAKTNGVRVDFIWDNENEDWKIDIGGDISSVLGGGGMGGSNPVSVSGNTTANVGDFLFVDTTTNSIVITLPNSSTLESGDGVSVYDSKGKFGLNNVVVNPINATISGDTSFTGDINNLRVDFFYNADDNDWKIDIGGALVSGSNTGIVYGTATLTNYGLVRIASDAESITGTNTTKVITPASLQAKLISHGLI